MNNKKAILRLEDGKEFIGLSVGAEGTTTGEICFNTGMTGYQEVFTDPSYYGQIVTMATSHIGNYGTFLEDVESDSVKIKGLVTKSFSEVASRPLADDTLQDYFVKNNIVGISNIDTRELVRYVRDKGAMNAIISTELDSSQMASELRNTPSMEGLELASKVSTKEPYLLGEDNTGFKVAVLDFGIKSNILRNFVKRNCICKVFPFDTNLDTLKEWGADGYFLSNGPGDPASMKAQIELAKEIILENKPTFGICLGHQILALANNVNTFKMHNGHRGVNHAVKNLITGKCEVTSQNHGFSVSRKDVENNADLEITHVNLNDETVEGIRMKSKPVFSVQHHPESSPGPNDSEYLFDDFINLLKDNN